MRAAFYYPWYDPTIPPDIGHWYPLHDPRNPSTDRAWTPVLGTYYSTDPAIIDNHIIQAKWANFSAFISSWQGRNTVSDHAIKPVLDRCQAASFKSGLLYEQDYNASRSIYAIDNDLHYLHPILTHPAFLKINNKPVVFVYQYQNGSINSINKWNTLRQQHNLFLVMYDVPQWFTVPDRADSWFHYDPALRGVTTFLGNKLFSWSASAGFWKAGETNPRLVRNNTEYSAVIQYIHQTYTTDFELAYFNEWVEGTGIEMSNADPNLTDSLESWRQV